MLSPNTLAVMFPGQGSQHVGMGKELFERYRSLERQASEILGFSVEDVCLRESADLSDTRYTQPCLFVVNAMYYLERQARGEPAPCVVAGHSLGEFNALLAAEVFDFETALRLVNERALLMSAANGGAMAAVLGLAPERVREVCQDASLAGLDVANVNSQVQTVISGTPELIERAEAHFMSQGAKAVIALRVSAAFHSRHMAESAAQFATTLSRCTFNAPRIPVIANVNAREYQAGQVAQLLAEQLRQPVLWLECVREMLRRGVSEFVEVGPGDVLGRLVKQIRAGEAAVPRSREAAEAVGGTTSVPPMAAKPAWSSDRARPTQAPLARDGDAGSLLGSAVFRAAYGLRYAYVVGGMGQCISSAELVIAAAREGVLSFLGSRGVTSEELSRHVQRIRAALTSRDAHWGVNIVFDADFPQLDRGYVDWLLREAIDRIEVAGYPAVTRELLRYRFAGRASQRSPRSLLAKVSHPAVAESFLTRPPEYLLRELIDQGTLSADDAALARDCTCADEIVVSGDSAWSTSRSNPLAVLPAMRHVRERVAARCPAASRVPMGVAGGIGCPAGVAAAFALGADFVLTGSINQCTQEANTSSAVKDRLCTVGLEDTHALAGASAWSLGAIQMLRKGTLFPANARRALTLHEAFQSWDKLGAAERERLERQYCELAMADALSLRSEVLNSFVPQLALVTQNDVYARVAAALHGYFDRAERMAQRGELTEEHQFLVHTGPALAAFNAWCAATPWADWRPRSVGAIARRLMNEAAELLRATAADSGERRPALDQRGLKS
jgi:trans-AT polyketide synthase/acyltransferase/oxidoreductase domain-containing protein